MVKHFFFSLPSVKNPKFFKEDLEQMLFRSKRRSITGISGRASVTRSDSQLTSLERKTFFHTNYTEGHDMLDWSGNYNFFFPVVTL